MGRARKTHHIENGGEALCVYADKYRDIVTDTPATTVMVRSEDVPVLWLTVEAARELAAALSERAGACSPKPTKRADAGLQTRKRSTASVT